MARSPDIRRTRDAGFTMVELVVIIVLVAILAFTAIPRFMDKGAVDVSAQAEQLASDIRYTQSLAMTTGQRNRINLSSASYSITTSDGTALPHPATGATDPITLSDVTLSGWNPPLTSDYVAFDGLGVPYSLVTSSTGITGNATITLTAGGHTRSVVISPETGRVIVQ